MGRGTGEPPASMPGSTAGRSVVAWRGVRRGGPPPSTIEPAGPARPALRHRRSCQTALLRQQLCAGLQAPAESPPTPRPARAWTQLALRLRRIQGLVAGVACPARALPAAADVRGFPHHPHLGWLAWRTAAFKLGLLLRGGRLQAPLIRRERQVQRQDPTQIMRFGCRLGAARSRTRDAGL